METLITFGDRDFLVSRNLAQGLDNPARPIHRQLVDHSLLTEPEVNRSRTLRKEMSAPAIGLPVLDTGVRLNCDPRAETLSIAARADENDFQPLIGVIRVVMKEGLRTLFKIRIVLSIGHEKVEKTISIIVSPGRAAPTTHDRVRDSSERGDIGKCPISVVTIKMIRTFAYRIAP